MDRKGRVIPVSSQFPAEEALKASKRVQETINEHQQQLEHLRGYVEDNVNLINLVARLPDETHHYIMVPFGKAAFFPGRLVHTDEFTVLLGEGYYAERSAKQTIEILKRREKVLEDHVQSVEAIIKDLKAEASFFDSTAMESSEGIVEIHEDYVEEGSPRASFLAAGNDKSTLTEDEEYERILSRISELEKEEEADELSSSEPAKGAIESGVSKLSLVEPARKSIDHRAKTALQQPQDPIHRSAAAFTGSIVERDDNLNLGPNLTEAQTSSRSSKPVSRFKMQRK